MRSNVKFEGGRELLAALNELKSSLAKPVMRRAAKLALQPVLTEVRRLAPVAEHEGGALRDSYVIGTQLTPRERRGVRIERETEVEVYMGTSNPAGLLQEFGTRHHPPQPHVRPAWAAKKDEVLNATATELRNEIDKAAARAAKRGRPKP